MTTPPQKRPTRVPVLMSAFVCPGSGQCMQGKWFLGVFYFVAFLAAIFMFFKTMCGPLIANLNASIDMANGQNCAFVETPLLCGINYFVLALTIHFLNVLSAWRGYVKESSKWREAQMVKAIENAHNPPKPPPLPGQDR